jgi:carbon starvation protein
MSMMAVYALAVLGCLGAGYLLYGRFIERMLRVSADEPVPSARADGMDFVPANRFVLLGHHFSSIAGAGPIVGPLIAGAAFGWLPGILWIVAGTVFIGGVHDFASLVVSLRHGGRSIAEVARRHVNARTYRLFLGFIWLALMYVVAVFADLAAGTFAADPSVAQVSVAYLVVAVVFGVLLYRVRLPLGWLTAAALAVLAVALWYNLGGKVLVLDKRSWVLLLLGYAFTASVLPVWLLLQPRDYLSGFLLYAAVAAGLVGVLFGGHRIAYPAFVAFNAPAVGPLVPFLFITVACGAVSGFHALVASGTTARQLARAHDARFVAYGGMVLEGVVAMIALATLMMLAPDTPLAKRPPTEVFAAGIGRFVSLLGVRPESGQAFGLLVLSAFILTTLDSATRIARYVFEELVGMGRSTVAGRLSATAASLVLPVVLLNVTVCDAGGNAIPCWKAVWPLFGTTNQLLAALVLVVVFLWVRSERCRPSLVVLAPAVFMLVMTIAALVHGLVPRVTRGAWDVMTVIGVLLLVLAAVVVTEVVAAVARAGRDGPGGVAVARKD